MKKIIFLVCFMLTLSVFGQDFSSYCSKKEPTKNFTGTLSSAFGINSITRKTIEHAIARELKKEANGKFKVKIDTFWGVKITNGEFEHLKISSSKMAPEGFYLTDTLIETICPYNKISYENNKLLVDENIVVKYETNITQDDLNKIIKSARYQKLMDEANRKVASLVKLETTLAEIKDNKLCLQYKITPIVSGFSYLNKLKPAKISIKTGLKVENGKIILSDIESGAKNSILASLINKLNPLNYQTKLEDNEFKASVKNVAIENNVIKINGNAVVLKK